MSQSEIDATVSASFRIHPNGMLVKGGLNGALPVLDESGAARANLLLALLFGDRLKTSLELQLPIAGVPSTLALRVALSIAVR
jgi:hypothetical protein